ncbi:proteinase-activated receptor 1 isoform X2 [Protopterus annectens]|uniref:proteinase-activated receptor 1 isoform X2 n=1 Tax=Protopterus annectens TaxID=7888 RepID=UPI001CFBE7F9|nr:proteinase-activated receptor 1 isoform X2 [Protopterus annectens]
MAFCGALILLIVPFLCAAADADTNGTVKNVTQSNLMSAPPRGFSILKRYHQQQYDQFPEDDEESNQSDEGSGLTFFISRDSHSKSDRTEVKYIDENVQWYLTSKWMTLFVPSVYSFTFAMSLPLNLLSILVFLARRKLKKPAVIYMMNLAVADVLFTVLLPFKISYHVSGNDWQFGPVLCQIMTAAFYCNMYCSVLLIACISVDRFLAVVYPIQSLSWRSNGHAYLVCVITWIVAIAGSIPLLCTDQTAEVPGLNITSCHDVLDLSKFKDYYIYFFPCFSLVFFFVPLVITAFCYFRILRCLSTTNKAGSCRRTRAIFLAAAVLNVFIICFVPTNVLLVVHYLQFTYGYNNSTYFGYLLSLCVGSLNCCIDPLIYYGGSSQRQEHFYKFVCCVKRSKSSSSNNQSNNRDSKTSSITTKLTSSIYMKLLA